MIHVLPVNDIQKHDEETTCCCDPNGDVTGAEILVIHNAFDGRE